MRKWQDLAAPDDPGAWFDIGNMWPTKRGSYETADVSQSVEYDATGADVVRYAFGAKTLSAAREYVIAGSKIWEFSGTSLTDRTGGVTVGGVGKPYMAQYGSITVCVMGAANATVSSSGGNFAALAGAPKGEIVCVQSNAVLIFNTDTSADGWAASDVGDYTNWTTGEASSGRIIATPGQITAAVPYGNDVFVFKRDSIYRMTYVGGVVKWQIQLVWKGKGVAEYNSVLGNFPKYQAVASPNGIAFVDAYGTDTGYADVYLYDGASPPVHINPMNRFTANAGQYHVLTYHPGSELLRLSPGFGANASGAVNSTESKYYYFNFVSGAWGQGCGGAGEVTASNAQTGLGVLFGSAAADSSDATPKPIYWAYQGTADKLKRNIGNTAPASCYLQTAKVGRADRKTLFSRLIPLLRRRTDLGTDSASLEMTLFREREDTSAQTTRTISESTTRKRFDLTGGVSTDNFARFKVTWTALDVEVDDFQVMSQDAGTD